MKNYKIAVYAIAKNEEKFVDRWIDSMSEADDICVIDTGSDDHTAEKLRARGAYVIVKKYDQWRFDTPRNDAMRLCPEDTDIFVSTDLDEVFEKGWRQKLEDAWTDNTTVCRYDYIWSFNKDGMPSRKFRYQKIHSKGYEWRYPVHELLFRKDGREDTYADTDILLMHYPDKSKSRSSYLPLLKLAVAEIPNDCRMKHYLGRELTFYGRWEEAADTLKSYLSMPGGWSAERAASMRYIGRAYSNLGNDDLAELWYRRGIDEDSFHRECAYELAQMMYNRKNWTVLKYAAESALKVTSPSNDYVTELACWDWKPYDWLGIAQWNLGLKAEAKRTYAAAIRKFQNVQHLKDNLARC